MPTRFYLPSSGTAGASPAFGSQWNTTTSAVRSPAVTTKSNTAFSNTALAKISQAGGQNRLFRQFVSAPLSDQTITGTFTSVLQGFQATTASDSWLQVVLRVVSGDGTTQRGVLFSGSTATAVSATSGAENQEFATALQTRIKPSTAVTSVSALAGDRLVIEIGFRAITANTDSVTLRFGDTTSSTDAALSAGTTTTTIAPWVELSFNLTFQTSTNRAFSVTSDNSGYFLNGVNLPPTNHSMCAWLYLEQDLNRFGTAYEVSNSSTGYIQNSTGSDGVTLGIHQNGSGGNSTSSMVLATWWKFAMVIGPTVRMFAAPAGSALAQVQTDPLVAISPTVMSFGYSIAWPGEYFPGRMAALKIWSSELSVTELDTEFTQYKAVRVANLFGEWTQWSGPSTEDSSGNNRSLTGNGLVPTDVAGPPGIPLGTSAASVAVTNLQFHVLA